MITIIIATYNADKYLQRCINSISNQTDQNYEFIIIDGNSSDNTLKIIEVNRPKIKQFISENDEGIYDAWNKGINMTSNQWVMFIGADDVLMPDTIQNYNEFIKDLPISIDYVSSKVNLVSENGKLIRVHGKEWKWNTFKKYMTVAHVGSLHSVGYFTRHGYFNPDYKIAGDYELLLRAGPNLQYRYMDKIVADMEFGGVSLENSLVFKETFRAKRDSGKINVLAVFFDDIIARTKFFLKKKIRYGK